MPRPSNRFAIAKPRLNTKNGTATLVVHIPGPGVLTLTGNGLVSQRAVRAAHRVASGIVKLTVRPNGKARKKLSAKGTLGVRVKVTFAPTGGRPASKTSAITLKLER